MQLTNNNTNVTINEQDLLNLIIDQRIVSLEKVFAAHYGVSFINVPEKARHTHFFLCRAVLGLQPFDLAEVYNTSENEIVRVTELLNTRWQVNREWCDYMAKFYFKYKNNLEKSVA